MSSRWHPYSILFAMSAVMLLAIPGLTQELASPARGRVVTPISSLPVPGMPHTPLLVFMPEAGPEPALPGGETPASIACIYGVTQHTAGCLKSGTLLPQGGSRAIAVIEYGTNSTMHSDLINFSTTFNLPAPNVTEVCVLGTCPSNDGTGWDVETSLDVQWAHAMAPHAQLFVVEGGSDLFAAVDRASQLVSDAGGGEISNSWVTSDGGEPANELQLDAHFQTNGIVYFAAAGDWGLGALYPSSSPDVVSAGGTSIERDGSGNFTGETCWSDSGGGVSRFESLPAYQRIVGNIATHRATPDWAADADPASGVAIYNTTYCHGWCRAGGTSAASPILAAIVNQTGTFLHNTNDELSKTYYEYSHATLWLQYFNDIRTGSNGSPAKFGWDECTGLGTPKNPAGL